VTWQITLTNTRTYPLFRVTLTDDASPSCVTAFEDVVSTSDDGNTLAPLETLVFTCDLEVGEGAFINTVSADGVDPWDQEIDPVSDTATTTIVLASGTIGDLVWSDDNGNGIQDNGEKGIAGATVTLTLPDGSTLSTTTNANGLYLFSALPAGTFTAQLVMSSIPAPSDGSNKLTTPAAFTISLGEGQSVLTADFGVTTALPTTGLESDLIAAIGFALALIGAAVLVATRRRRDDDGNQLPA
jgi:LPXTG-motif cell wall-anchored protein